MNEPLAMVSNYCDLIVALRARCEELRISREALDHISGLQSGYAGKLLAMPRPQTSMRVLGRTSFDLMLPALGLKLAVLEDEAAMRRLRKRLGDPHLETMVRAKPLSTVASTNSPPGLRAIFLRTIGTLGGYARASKLSPKRRIAIARRAAKTRWRRARQVCKN
jgi:hypothetical protein